MMYQKRKAFTLIELLIVVAIIAILAAIAVPNFLEAQVRSKASRAKTDLRTLATAMEAYKLDQNDYPARNAGTNAPWLFLWVLTTPVAYATSIAEDPFPEKTWSQEQRTIFIVRQYDYYGGKVVGSDPSVTWVESLAAQANAPRSAYEWILFSNGPDRNWSWGQYAILGEQYINQWKGPLGARGTAGAIYDATNGTVSVGDIVRIGP